MAAIDFTQATAEPEDLSLEPVDLPRRPVTPDPTVEIPDQLLSARRSFEARDDLASGKRNLNDPINDEAFQLAGSLAMQIPAEEIKIELDVSNTTRGELGLDPSFGAKQRGHHAVHDQRLRPRGPAAGLSLG